MKYPEVYRERSSYPLVQAQNNLQGRTHYVDNDTLRFHKSRVLACHITDGGLLLSIVTSDAIDMDGSKRGFRFVVFDVFGTVINRPSLEDTFPTRKAATKAMWIELNALDAFSITRDGCERHARNTYQSLGELRDIARYQRNAKKVAA